MSRIKYLTASCSHFVHQYFIWFLIGSYAVASVCPALGLWIREVSLGEVGLFREKMTVTLPMKPSGVTN
jgi:BASS family bile acid:Na+ symporter